jgi:hypothetical protein
MSFYHQRVIVDIRQCFDNPNLVSANTKYLHTCFAQLIQKDGDAAHITHFAALADFDGKFPHRRNAD